MTIEIKKIDEVKTIKKPWGYERWIADGSPNFKYALKEILFRATYKSSIQFHEFKEETNYVQKGKGILYYSPQPIDITKFQNNGYSEADIKKILLNLEKRELLPGMVFHVKPGAIHRIEAIDDLTLIESSSIELDDVFRLNDEWGRADGKIEIEHTEKLDTHNLFSEQSARYLFVKNFIKGKVLDVTANSFMEYSAAKILLEGGASEVWHYNITSTKKSYNVRKFGPNKAVEFDLINETDKLPDKSFDCIISSLILQYVKQNETINEYYRILKNHGLLIISIRNKETLIDNKNFGTDITNLPSRAEFETLIKKKFPQMDLYSQIEISKIENIEKYLKPFSFMKGKIRKTLSRILLKIDKNSNFYKLHLQRTILNVDGTVKKINEKIYNKEYFPQPYKENSQPLYFIALCKKINH